MKISFSMRRNMMDTATGFGRAGFELVRSLQELGHEVPFKDPAADVEIAFGHPHQWEWSRPDNYRIGYFPFESTSLKPGWSNRLDAVDEVWVTAPWMIKYYQPLTTSPVFLYEHGIDVDQWTRTKRRRGETLKFLHVGEPAPRKGGQLALDAFRTAFGDRTDVQLTIKAHGYNTALADSNRHPTTAYNNIRVLTKELNVGDLIGLFATHDVMVYPSFGEGFGLIPLQAIISGMPTICTEGWAGYKKHILPELRLRSALAESPWPTMHPGKMWHPSYGDLVNKYRYAEEHFTSLSSRAYAQSLVAAEDYKWSTVTQRAFDHIIQK